MLGAFDPLEKIADLCEKYNLWMHVDAAWGGGALMSQKYKKLLKGIERYVKFKSTNAIMIKSLNDHKNVLNTAFNDIMCNC